MAERIDDELVGLVTQRLLRHFVAVFVTIELYSPLVSAREMDAKG